eukprot:c25329_g1_i1 orf=306-3188(+)
MAEIQEEAANGDAGSFLEVPVIGVCVGKERKGILALNWVLREKLVQPQGSVYLLHVRPPLRWIPNPMGGKLPVDQVNPEVVKRFEDERLLDTKKLVNNYKKICDKYKVAAELCYSISDSVQKEIVDQISKLGITKLVLETSSQNALTRALKKESISAYVAKHAPDFCTVLVIRNGKLYSVKDATQSHLICSARSSFTEASDTSTSLFSETSSPIGEITEGQLMRSSGFQNGERDMHSGVKDDPRNISHMRRLQSASMDISPGSRLMSHNSGNLLMRNYSALPQPSRFLESAPATPFHEEPSNRLHYCRIPDNDNARSSSDFESWAFLASDVSPLEARSSVSSSQGHEFTSPPPGVPLADLDGPSNSVPANGSINRTMDISDLYPDPQTSIGVGNWIDLCSPEGSSVQFTSPHVHDSVLMDSNTALASNEVVPPALECDLLQSQLNDAEQAAQWAQREAQRHAKDLRITEGVVASAKKMIAESNRQRDEALKEATFALQRASDYEKRYEEAVARVQAALSDRDFLKERLTEEVRRHQETQNELQEVTRNLEEERQLRREAEERASEEATAKREAVVALRREQQRYTEYSYQELQSATNNFHEDNKLGQGGYGPVYKGTLHHTPVAIKVLAREGSQGREEFQKEVELLSRIHHPHMVMLCGACPENGCIVYEYMANGSLEDCLNCRNGSPPLPWYVRFRICLEVATALLFLHSRPQPIVHRDLKPGNILLDHHFVSKIGDVGLAKLVPIDLTFSITMYKDSVLVGTFAYMDPDYQRTGVVSRESDVYSLGIVILQLLTGRPAVGVVDLVEDAVDRGELANVLDRSAGEWPLTEAMVLACLGLQCAEPRRKHRPKLEMKILPELESIQGVAVTAAANMASAGQSSSGTMPVIPGSFFCPILQEIMENPHLAADGFTYEYDAIKFWLQEHNTSPMTNLVLSHNNLIPNHSLRSAIDEWRENGLI